MSENFCLDKENIELNSNCCFFRAQKTQLESVQLTLNEEEKKPRLPAHTRASKEHKEQPHEEKQKPIESRKTK